MSARRRMSLIAALCAVGVVLLLSLGRLDSPRLATRLDAASAASKGLHLTLSPAKEAFAAGEPIELTLTLTNTGSEPVLVSPVVDGVLELAAAAGGDGGRRKADQVIRYRESLGFLLTQSLVELAPGGSTSWVWRSHANEELGGQALTTVEFTMDDDDHRARSILVGAPGSNRLRVFYDFPDKVEAPAGTETARSNVATAEFEVKG